MGTSDNAKGLILAVGSSLFIGTSFILKKKGLKRAVDSGTRAVIFGEVANFEAVNAKLREILFFADLTSPPCCANDPGGAFVVGLNPHHDVWFQSLVTPIHVLQILRRRHVHLHFVTASHWKEGIGD
ncbi:unnamed protein product [Camellia sinensis]